MSTEEDEAEAPPPPLARLATAGPSRSRSTSGLMRPPVALSCPKSDRHLTSHMWGGFPSGRPRTSFKTLRKAGIPRRSRHFLSGVSKYAPPTSLKDNGYGCRRERLGGRRRRLSE